MNKIEKMTAQQASELIEFRVKWLAIGLSTEEADRPRAERAWIEMYKLLGKPVPKIIWMNSDLGCLFAWICLNNIGANIGDNLWANLGDNLWANIRANLGANLGDNLRANLRDNLRDNLWTNLGDNLGDNLRDNLWANLWANLWDNLGDNIGDNLWANLRDNLRANLRDNLGDNLRDNLGDNLGDKGRELINKFFWGNQESWWIAYYMFPHWYLRHMYSEENTNKLNLWSEIAQSCGWWLPFENVIFASNRPLEIHKDSRTRLHNENGMAVKFRDGWGLYSLHGVRVPAEYIETSADQIDPVKLLRETNAQIRMAVISKIGFQRLIRHLKTSTISANSNGDKLIEMDLGEQRVRALHLSWHEHDGQHETVLPVPSRKEDFGTNCPDNTDDFEQVRLWTFGLKPDQIEIVAES